MDKIILRLFFVDTDNITLKLNATTILKQRNQSTQFQDLLYNYINQDCMVSVEGQTYRSENRLYTWKQKREPRNIPTQKYTNTFLTGAKAI